MTQLFKGQVVQSRQGRDAGRLFVVVDIVDDQYVLIADGMLRKLEKPKRKKCKHLLVKAECISSLREKLESGQRIYDAQVKKAISSLGDQVMDAPCKEG